MQILMLVIGIFGIAGTILNIWKLKICFVLWGISNLAWLGVGIWQRNYGLILQFSVYTVFAVAGYIKWAREDRSKKGWK